MKRLPSTPTHMKLFLYPIALPATPPMPFGYGKDPLPLFLTPMVLISACTNSIIASNKGMEEELSLAEKKRGRPLSGVRTVVFYRRLPQDVAVQLGRWVDDNLDPVSRTFRLPAGRGEVELEVPRRQDNPTIKALVEDVERQAAEIQDLKGRLERCARATDDEKARHWMHRCLKCEGRKKSEFDQEAS